MRVRAKARAWARVGVRVGVAVRVGVRLGVRVRVTSWPHASRASGCAPQDSSSASEKGPLHSLPACGLRTCFELGAG